MIQITINTKKKIKEALQPTRCKTDSVESTDDREKDTKTKKEKPIRTITKTTKCDLENVKSPGYRFKKKLTKDDSGKVVMSKAVMDDLLGTNNSRSDNEKTSVDLDSLRGLLGVEGETLDDILRNKIKETLNSPEFQTETIKTLSQRRKQKERDKEKRKQLDREAVVNPMKSIQKDFDSLANGIMETDFDTNDLDEFEKASATLRQEVEDMIELKWGDNPMYQEAKKQKKDNCVQGNPYHSPPGEDGGGQFTSKKDAGSWSLQWSKAKGDCKGGVASMSGGSERFAKKPCGRKNKHGGKSKEKCGKDKT